MGYRCPNCHQDFGIEKDKFLNHIRNCGNANLCYNYFADKDAFHNKIADFCQTVGRVHDKFNRNKIGTKAERERFYKELENGKRNPKYL